MNWINSGRNLCWNLERWLNVRLLCSREGEDVPLRRILMLEAAEKGWSNLTHEKYDIFVIHKVYPNVKNNNNLFFWIGMVYLEMKKCFSLRDLKSTLSCLNKIDKCEILMRF